MSVLLSPAELEQKLRQMGAERYHHKHPFHALLHGGRLDREDDLVRAVVHRHAQDAVGREGEGLDRRAVGGDGDERRLGHAARVLQAIEDRPQLAESIFEVEVHLDHPGCRQRHEFAAAMADHHVGA